MNEAEVALYLDDDRALGRVVSALEACGYIPAHPGTEVAKRGEVAGALFVRRDGVLRRASEDAVGPPEAVAACPASYTGQALQRLLARAAPEAQPGVGTQPCQLADA